MTLTITPQTPEAIEALKRSWRADPCWDIEDTDGFEVHRDELVQYREAFEAELRARAQAALEAYAETLGCPDNLKLAQYVRGLETRLEHFEERLRSLETSQG